MSKPTSKQDKQVEAMREIAGVVRVMAAEIEHLSAIVGLLLLKEKQRCDDHPRIFGEFGTLPSEEIVAEEIRQIIKKTAIN